MPLPTLVKTWNFDVNIPSQGVPTSSANSDVRWGAHYFDLKQALLGIAPGWTVAGSGGAGNGGGGGMDAVDRWTNGNDLDVTGSAPTQTSWIVLQNDAIRVGFQLLIQPDNNAGGWPGAGLFLQVSPGGLYTGGSQTTSPTAADAVTVGGTTVNSGSSPETPITHLAMSSDGAITRWWLTWGGDTHAFFEFAIPTNTVPGWTDPWVATAVYNGLTNAPDYADLTNVTTYTRGRQGSINMALYWTSEGWNFDATNAAAGQRMTWGNDLDGGAFPMAPIGLASETSFVRGRHGELTDVWWGTTILATGSYYPETLPRQFVQLGDIIVPWDQTAGKMQML